MPISLFKSHKVIVGEEDEAELVFTSSGTTGSNTSRHFVKKKTVYEESFINAFEWFYGNIEDYCILALLPSYFEQKGSSLIYMVSELIQRSGHESSGFYLDYTSRLREVLIRLDRQEKKVLLIGVSFALLDLVEQFHFSLSNTIIMETGGMKGRRKELVREELHDRLKKGFGVDNIHSEYGMTELLSQAYAKKDGRFYPPPWMKVLIRDINDPFTLLDAGSTGGINVIDMANIHSCPFIETMDLGRVFDDGSFEVLGRFDNSDIRGCNLMVV
ncbi:MAG: acyl transferase [Bacteroidota bacterium]